MPSVFTNFKGNLTQAPQFFDEPLFSAF